MVELTEWVLYPCIKYMTDHVHSFFFAEYSVELCKNKLHDTMPTTWQSLTIVKVLVFDNFSTEFVMILSDLHWIWMYILIVTTMISVIPLEFHIYVLFQTNPRHQIWFEALADWRGGIQNRTVVLSLLVSLQILMR